MLLLRANPLLLLLLRVHAPPGCRRLWQDAAGSPDKEGPLQVAVECSTALAPASLACPRSTSAWRAHLLTHCWQLLVRGQVQGAVWQCRMQAHSAKEQAQVHEAPAYSSLTCRGAEGSYWGERRSLMPSAVPECGCRPPFL